MKANIPSDAQYNLLRALTEPNSYLHTLYNCVLGSTVNMLHTGLSSHNATTVRSVIARNWLEPKNGIKDGCFVVSDAGKEAFLEYGKTVLGDSTTFDEWVKFNTKSQNEERQRNEAKKIAAEQKEQERQSLIAVLKDCADDNMTAHDAGVWLLENASKLLEFVQTKGATK